ncbi:MAG: hypothetical protein EOM58_02835 [Clostridia bacterium]|nr:hypothetical protein [Clostridia bacterium]
MALAIYTIEEKMEFVRKFEEERKACRISQNGFARENGLNKGTFSIWCRTLGSGSDYDEPGFPPMVRIGGDATEPAHCQDAGIANVPSIAAEPPEVRIVFHDSVIIAGQQSLTYVLRCIRKA